MAFPHQRVLIAEKQGAIAQTIAAALEQAGFDTTVVETGERALEELRSNPPDVALLEVLMPKLLGTEVCLAAKQSEKLSKIPVILMSAGLKELEGISIAQTEYRADDYLLKPFQPGLLLEKIQQNLQRSARLNRKTGYDVDELLRMPDDEAAAITAARHAKNSADISLEPDGTFHRYNPRAPLNIKVDVDSTDTFFSSPMMNISKGGIFLRTDDPLPVGRVLNLQFTLPDSARVIKGQGRVVWVERPGGERPAGMGVRFKDFPEQDLKIVYAYVRRLRQFVR